jgi:hypothetical protein
MDRDPELQLTLGEEATKLVASIEQHLSMLRGRDVSPEVIDELGRLLAEIRSYLTPR